MEAVQLQDAFAGRLTFSLMYAVMQNPSKARIWMRPIPTAMAV
jgi:hypothetical protein